MINRKLSFALLILVILTISSCSIPQSNRNDTKVTESISFVSETEYDNIPEKQNIKLLNTSGNTLNGNLADEDDEWIYYSTYEDVGYSTGGLYRENKSTGLKEKIIDSKVLDFAVEGEYIYYRVYTQIIDDSYMFDSNDCTLFKMNLLTLESTKLFDLDIFDAYYTDKYIIGTTGEKRSLICIDYITGESYTINDRYTGNVVINDNWIYLSDCEGVVSIAKYSVNGDKISTLIEGKDFLDYYSIVLIEDDWLYYECEAGLKRMNLNNKVEELIFNDEFYSINVFENNIYLLNTDMQLFRMSLDGSDKELYFDLSEMKLEQTLDFIKMCIVNNRIFIYSYMLDKTYIIDTEKYELTELL